MEKICVSIYLAKWERNLTSAVTFHSVHGRWPTKHDGRVGTWVAGQQTKHKKGRLPPDLIERLSATPGWIWNLHDYNLHDYAWNQHYNQAVRHFAQHGYWPGQYASDKEVKKLGKWVYIQRTMRRANTLGHLRFVILDSTPGWTWECKAKNRQPHLWRANLAQAVNFFASHGHWPRKDSKESNEQRLAGWIAKQRSSYGYGDLHQSRINVLNATEGWRWKGADAQWERKLKECNEFRQRTGHWPVKGGRETGGKLSAWLRTQRDRYAQGTLESERIAILEHCPDWSWTSSPSRNKPWSVRAAQCLAFTKQHGQLPSSYTGDQDEISLASWCKIQRRAKQSGSLTVERQAILEAIPGWTWRTSRTSNPSRHKQWSMRAALCLDFVKHHGQLPSSYTGDRNEIALASWCKVQRRVKQSGSLTVERQAILEAIPGWKWIMPRGPRNPDPLTKAALSARPAKD